MDNKILLALDAVYKGKSAFDAARSDVKGLEKDATASSSKTKSAMSGIGVAAGVMGAALGAAGIAAALAYKKLGEGAALIDAKHDFEDLAGAAGSSADSMLASMDKAAGGMMTDAELMASATQLMTVNLGMTADQYAQVVGLTAELGLNIENVAKTMNTQSTRGLQEAGFNITAFKERMAELEAQGIATDKAFQMAWIEAAEAKIAIIGKTSDETTGKIKQLTAAFEGAGDAFSIAFATGLGKQLEGMALGADGLGDSLGYAATGAGELAANLASIPLKLFSQLGANSQINQSTDFLEGLGLTPAQINAGQSSDYKGLAQSTDEAMVKEANRLKELEEKWRAYAAGRGQAATDTGELAGAIEEAAVAEEALADASERSAFQIAQGRRSAIERAESGVSAWKSERDFAAAAEESAAAAERAAAAVERRAASGAAFEDARTAAPETALVDANGVTNVQNLNTALYDQVVAAGGSATALALAGVATKQFTLDQAEAYIKTIALAGEAERLGQMVADGAISIDTAIRVLGLFSDQLDSGTIPSAETAATKIGNVRTEMENLDGTTAAAKVDVDNVTALGNIGEVRTEMDRVDGMTAVATVNVDTSEANRQLDVLLGRIQGFGNAALGLPENLGGPSTPNSPIGPTPIAPAPVIPQPPPLTPQSLIPQPIIPGSGRSSYAAKGGAPVSVSINNTFQGAQSAGDMERASDRMARRLSLILRNEGRTLS